MPKTESSGITDGVSVEVNGDEVNPKGPADDRLAGHEAESKVFAERLTAEAGG